MNQQQQQQHLEYLCEFDNSLHVNPWIKTIPNWDQRTTLKTQLLVFDRNVYPVQVLEPSVLEPLGPSTTTCPHSILYLDLDTSSKKRRLGNMHMNVIEYVKPFLTQYSVVKLHVEIIIEVFDFKEVVLTFNNFIVKTVKIYLDLNSLSYGIRLISPLLCPLSQFMKQQMEDTQFHQFVDSHKTNMIKGLEEIFAICTNTDLIDLSFVPLYTYNIHDPKDFVQQTYEHIMQCVDHFQTPELCRQSSYFEFGYMNTKINYAFGFLDRFEKTDMYFEYEPTFQPEMKCRWTHYDFKPKGIVCRNVQGSDILQTIFDLVQKQLSKPYSTKSSSDFIALRAPLVHLKNDHVDDFITKLQSNNLSYLLIDQVNIYSINLQMMYETDVIVITSFTQNFKSWNDQKAPMIHLENGKQELFTNNQIEKLHQGINQGINPSRVYLNDNLFSACTFMNGIFSTCTEIQWSQQVTPFARTFTICEIQKLNTSFRVLFDPFIPSSNAPLSFLIEKWMSWVCGELYSMDNMYMNMDVKRILSSFVFQIDIPFHDPRKFIYIVDMTDRHRKDKIQSSQ